MNQEQELSFFEDSTSQKETTKGESLITMPSKRLPYRARRMLAILKGKENIDDFGKETRTLELYNIKRDLFISCNETDLAWYLENI